VNVAWRATLYLEWNEGDGEKSGVLGA
jgi:hypothetical protein